MYHSSKHLHWLILSVESSTHDSNLGRRGLGLDREQSRGRLPDLEVRKRKKRKTLPERSKNKVNNIPNISSWFLYWNSTGGTITYNFPGKTVYLWGIIQKKLFEFNNVTSLRDFGLQIKSCWIIITTIPHFEIKKLTDKRQ